MEQMQVVVPPEVGPGMAFIVNTPSGQMQVTCPPDATAGGQMQVNFPALPRACSLPAEVLSTVPQALVMAMPVDVMAQPYASQVYVAMSEEVVLATGQQVFIAAEVLPAAAASNTPGPKVMVRDEDLKLLKEVLAETQPGKWESKMTSPPVMPCMCIKTQYAIHPLALADSHLRVERAGGTQYASAQKQYRLLGRNHCYCCYIPCMCSIFNPTIVGAIEETGTSWQNSGSDGGTLRGVLAAIDPVARTATYSMSGWDAQGQQITGKQVHLHRCMCTCCACVTMICCTCAQVIDSRNGTANMRWHAGPIDLKFVSQKVLDL